MTNRKNQIKSREWVPNIPNSWLLADDMAKALRNSMPKLHGSILATEEAIRALKNSTPTLSNSLLPTKDVSPGLTSISDQLLRDRQRIEEMARGPARYTDAVIQSRQQMEEIARGPARFAEAVIQSRRQMEEIARGPARFAEAVMQSRRQMEEIARGPARFADTLLQSRRQMEEIARGPARFTDALIQSHRQMEEIARGPANIAERVLRNRLQMNDVTGEFHSYPLISPSFSSEVSSLPGVLSELHHIIQKEQEEYLEALKKSEQEYREGPVGRFTLTLRTFREKLQHLSILFNEMLHITTFSQVPESLDETVALLYRDFLDCEEFHEILWKTPVYQVIHLTPRQAHCWYRVHLVARKLAYVEKRAFNLYELLLNS